VIARRWLTANATVVTVKIRKGHRPVVILAGLIVLVTAMAVIFLLEDGRSDRPQPYNTVALEKLSGDIVVRFPEDPRVDQITSNRLAELTRGDLVEGPPGANELAVLRSGQVSSDGRPLWHYATWAATLCALAGLVLLAVKLRSRER
jgi:hypothetical protein